MKNLTKLAVLMGFAVLGGGAAQATTIPSTINTTITITTDSKLTGPVTCTVPAGTACIKFGANNITLKLNGFSITGTAASPASCTPLGFVTVIDTNSKNNVVIRGPGLITQFNGTGINVSGNNSSVEGVAITSMCLGAIFVSGSYNEIEGNSISRAEEFGTGIGQAIFISGAEKNNGHNRILHNEVGETGSGSGISVGATQVNPSPGNLIEENNFSGNSFIGIFIDSGSAGNVARHNQALGNLNGDIVDNNAAGANTYDNNLCQTASGGASCQTPDIAGHSNFEPSDE